MEELKKTDVHAAMIRAVDQTEQAKDTVICGFRLERYAHDFMKEICERHGTSLSEFLRQCCHGLIKDYIPHDDC